MRRSRRLSRAVLVAATVAVSLLVGTGVAGADSGDGNPNSRSPVCTTRIPAVLDRIDRITDRIQGDADTAGSTAWLSARSRQARAAGFTALADLLEARAQARPQRLDELAALKRDVQDVQSTDCAA